MKVAVSFLSSNYSLEETISILDKSACDYIHVDIMDGVFVNNKTYDEDINYTVFYANECPSLYFLKKKSTNSKINQLLGDKLYEN